MFPPVHHAVVPHCPRLFLSAVGQDRDIHQQFFLVEQFGERLVHFDSSFVLTS
jgi:hypothetical protein